MRNAAAKTSQKQRGRHRRDAVGPECGQIMKAVREHDAIYRNAARNALLHIKPRSPGRGDASARVVAAHQTVYAKRMNHAPLALTMGEPAGIAAEITAKAWWTVRARQPRRRSSTC